MDSNKQLPIYHVYISFRVYSLRRNKFSEIVRTKKFEKAKVSTTTTSLDIDTVNKDRYVARRLLSRVKKTDRNAEVEIYKITLIKQIGTTSWVKNNKHK